MRLRAFSNTNLTRATHPPQAIPVPQQLELKTPGSPRLELLKPGMETMLLRFDFAKRTLPKAASVPRVRRPLPEPRPTPNPARVLQIRSMANAKRNLRPIR